MAQEINISTNVAGNISLVSNVKANNVVSTTLREASIVASVSPVIIATSDAAETGPAGPTGASGGPGPAGDPGVVQSIVAGSNVTVDSSDPAHPIVSSTGGGGGGGGANWGEIGGTLSSQTDLQTALDSKQSQNTNLDQISGITPSVDDIIQYKGSNWTRRTPAQVKSDMSLSKSDVGLSNVDNTADLSKPVSTAQQTAINAKVADALNDGETLVAPSQNVVYDALSLKEDLSNKDTDSTMAANSDTKYPSQKAVKTALATKQNVLAYTPENVANKDTDTTLAANSDTKYPSQKAIKTYVDNTQTGPNIPSNLFICGHSYLDPLGIGIRNQPANNFSTGKRIAAMLGVTPGKVNNLAKSGAALRAANTNGAPRYLHNINPGNTYYYPQVPKTGVSFCWFGINDLILGTGTFVQNGIKNGYRSLISRLRASSVWDYNDSTVTATGSWTETLYSSTDPIWGSGDGCWGSSTVGDYITIDLPSDLCTDVDGLWVSVGFVTSTTGGVVKIELDGVTQGYCSTGTSTFSSSERGSNVFRVWVTSSNTQIKCTIDSLTSGGPVYFDYWQVEASPSPLVLVGEITVPPNPQSQWSGITVNNIDTANGWIQDVIDEFNDPAVRLVSLDTALGGANNRLYYQTASADYTYYSHDGLHPNARGSEKVAQLVTEAVQDALNDGVERRQINGYWPDESDPLSVIELTISHGDGAPLQLYSDFEGDDSNTTPSGWTEKRGGWGNYQGELAVVNNKWAYPAFYDKFSRADGSVGNSWSTAGATGTWNIASGEVQFTSGTGSTRKFLLQSNKLDGSGNGYIEATVGVSRENNAGIVFRYQDTSNFWELVESVTFGSWILRKMVAGSVTTVKNGGLGSNATGTTMHIEVNGSSIAVYNSDGTTYSTTDSDLSSQRTVGFVAQTAVSQPQFDDFKCHNVATDLSDDPGFNMIYHDFGFTDNVVSFTVGANRANFNGIVMRYVDKDNYTSLYMSTSFGNWVFAKRVAGTTSSVANITGSNSTGTSVTVKLDGDNYTFYFNGVASTSGTKTVSSGPAGTKYGFRTEFTSVTTIPYGFIDNVSTGSSFVPITEGSYYRDDLDGTFYGPFSNGSASAAFQWLPKSLANAKGDIIVATANDTVTRQAVGSNGTGIVADSTATTGMSYGYPSSLRSYLKPTASTYESQDRLSTTFANMAAALTSGTISMWGIALPAGVTLSSVTFISGTTALSGGNNQWAFIADSSRVVKAISSDGTSGAWSTNSAKTFTFGSSYTTTAAGFFYIGLMVNAATVPSLMGCADGTTTIGALAPIVAGSADTAQTTPPSLPFTATTLTAKQQKAYFYLS